MLRASGDQTIELISPLDGAHIAHLRISSDGDMAEAFDRAREAKRAWQSVSIKERCSIISRFHDLVLAEQSEILDIIQWENGKARGNAMDEVLDVLLTARYYSRISRKHLKSQKRRGAFPLATVTREIRHPRGVIGVISPWNYPFTLAVSDFIPAIIAGNSVVIKPDAQTPLSALWAIEKLRQAGMPAELVQVVMGEGFDIGPKIVERADYVMFTGSTRVGRTVAAQAGERLISASMELGGKNSLIIDSDVNIAFAAEAAARGAFANAGQLCIGTERIVVQASIYDEFLKAFIKQVNDLKITGHIGWGSDMGTLINQKQLQTTMHHIADAEANGALVVAGGHRLHEVSELAFAPTVLVNVSEAAQICSNETFGPVCSVYKWNQESDLLDFVNNTDYGLNAGIISRNISWAQALAPKIKAGTVNINEAFGSAYASIDAPMGGMGQSGVGRRHGVEGLLKYTEPQTVARQRWMKLSPQWWMDDAGWARFTSFAMRLLKGLRVK